MIKVPTIQHPYLEENMSNLTSASNEASVSASSINIISGSNMYPTPPFNQTQIHPVKRKRNQPGHPDPEAEVVALSPRTLMATNRFVCEVCNKGFQRDQNLQLHKRGHNLPWKLKQRIGNDIIRKKVYVCPESTCVHHEPSRALGDLTGIKKHFSRKHGEKKWKCERCSKKYAVLSDWKAHTKTCGTKEYRCDCGTIFSRRDSFITHRAFCDALAEEASRSTVLLCNNIITPFQYSTTAPNSHQLNVQQYQSQFTPTIKQEQQNFNLIRQEIPSWLSCSPNVNIEPGQVQDFSSQSHNNHSKMTTLPPYHTIVPPSPHISATALLQKAAQMGTKDASPTGLFITPHLSHVHNNIAGEYSEQISRSVGLNLSSHDEFMTSLASYGNKGENASLLLHDMMMMNNPHSSNGFGFDDNNGIIKGNETRDFLGLRPISQSDIMNSLSNCMSKNGNNDCNDNEDQG